MSLPPSHNKLLPAVLSKTALGNHDLCVQLFIPADLAFFSGHFPVVAIVPGVAQVDWAVHFAGLLVPQLNKLSIKKLKFQRPMLPGTTLNLNLLCDAEKPALRFSFQAGDIEYSSGEIHWDSPHVHTLCRNTGL